MSDDASPVKKRNPSSATGLADQASDVGRQMQDAATDVAQAAVETAKRQAPHTLETAKSLVSEAGERLQDEARGRKSEAADFVGRIAEAVKRAGAAVESDLPFAAPYIRDAAAQMDGASAWMRGSDFRDMVAQARAFARSRPSAFLALTVLAGFGMVRLLKSSGVQRTERGPDRVTGGGEPIDQSGGS